MAAGRFRPVRDARFARGSAPWILAAAVAAALGIGAVLAVRALREDRAAAIDPGVVHVHGLGINPADRALFIATHTGLFRLEPGSQRPERVGDSHQDTMGFTVVGPDHFLGSGHPDVRDRLPPLLGLIESRDAGETWTAISLRGEADFHALRATGSSVVGYDAANARVMISDDRGRNWRSSRPPELLIDVAVDPAAEDRLLAAGETRLFVSSDGGRTWEERQQGTGLLAWPRRDRLYLLDGGGRVWVSRDAGRRWQRRGDVGGRPAAILAVDATTLYAATHSGAIKESRDAGASWATRATP